jgi:hypothetical protein
MSERRTIMINPELFSLSGGNTTRKKRKSTEPKEIKVKDSAPKKQSSKTLRNKLLHYIRKTQEENYRKMHGQEPEIKVSTPSVRQPYEESFNNDFEESLKYLNEITENVQNTVPHQTAATATLKNYASMNHTNHYPIPELPAYEPSIPSRQDAPVHIHRPTPQWGCLKGGALPTYRSWKNHTQRNQVQTIRPVINVQTGGQLNQNDPVISVQPSLPINDTQREMIKQTQQKIVHLENQSKKPALKYGRRKKTIRRTYKVGKSKIAPKIGVLISNKTIRNTISTQKQHLKQIPIEDIRRTLIKRGFIKVGSIAPNDVLRQIYESMILVCGEVQNHNPDNLIYNFFNESA